jgi:hypothetical protein
MPYFSRNFKIDGWLVYNSAVELITIHDLVGGGDVLSPQNRQHINAELIWRRHPAGPAIVCSRD